MIEFGRLEIRKVDNSIRRPASPTLTDNLWSYIEARVYGQIEENNFFSFFQKNIPKYVNLANLYFSDSKYSGCLKFRLVGTSDKELVWTD